MKITKYGHAVIVSTLGIFIAASTGLMWSFIGGIMIGTGLYLARTSGLEENE